jgi:hypothetical protein
MPPGYGLLHASVLLIPAGLKEAVAAGGMTCETVVEAATEEALEVSMVCAWATAARAEAARMNLYIMMAERFCCECQRSIDAGSMW